MKTKTDIQYVSLDPKDSYSTNDIGIATTLTVKGYKLFSIKKDFSKRATFVFRREKGLDDAVERFWSNKIEVYPLEFLSTLKNLKSRIYASDTISF